MAKNVKFIRLGYDSAVDVSKYQSYQGEGNIIFAKVNVNGSWDTDTDVYMPPAYYIWANGIEYKVADADTLAYALTRIQSLALDVSTLKGDETIEGSIAKAIKDALDAYRPKAEHIVDLVDPAGNVTVELVDSSMMLNCEKAETQNDITIAKQVGYLKPGTTIPEGTTVEDLIKMIFTKVLGLEGCNNPSASISDIPNTTMEVGYVYSGSATATFNDGSWKNEEGWKNEYSGNKSTQAYGCICDTYKFTGMGVDDTATASNTAIIDNYTINKGNNNVKVIINHKASVNTPVNQNGISLTAGDVNDTTTYKPQAASATGIAASGTITGDYYYWIGYSPVDSAVTHLTRADLDNNVNFTTVKNGWSGSSITYDSEYTTPLNNYVTIIIPSTMTLKSITDSINNEVVQNFSRYEYNGGEIGLDSYRTYYVYQEKAVSGAGLIRKLIKIS